MSSEEIKKEVSLKTIPKTKTDTRTPDPTLELKEKSIKQPPLAKVNTTINIGKIYDLKKGFHIPKEIPKQFYSSLKTENII